MPAVVSGDICAKPLRTGNVCRLDPKHRGRHSAEVFICDSCGKRRRGKPASSEQGEPDGYPYYFCFMCVHESGYEL